jgi:putative aminopeptidase
MTSLLKKLSGTLAVSGYEWELGMAECIQTILKKKGTRIGDNLLYQIGTVGPKIFVSAHMDEVGFMATNVLEDGVSIVPIGEIDVSAVVGRRLTFMTKSGLQTSQPVAAAPCFLAIRVTGVSLNVGDVGSFEKCFSEKNGLITAPSLDNKVGCLALIETMTFLQKNKLPNRYQLFFCFACREEVSVNGIMSAVKKIDPDLCIDVDSAYAQPYVDSQNWSIPELGKGPAIQLMGSNFIVRAQNRRLIETIALDTNISYQYEIPEGENGGTNASTLVNAGYDVMQLNIPVRDQHTALSQANLKDISAMRKLITAILTLDNLTNIF